LIEALTGEPIAATLRNDRLLHYRLVQGKVPIPETIPKGWHALLKGLLERDHYRRWQAAEVRSWLDRETCRIGVAAEKKARPLLLVSLALALAMTIGAGLYLERLAPAPSPRFGNSAGRTHDTNLDGKSPAAPGVRPGRAFRAAGVDRDTRSGSFNALALVTITMTALAWVLASIFFLLGVTHALNGAPHGVLTILLGIVLALGAYFLPRLWG
jgi:hypothetical protein